ncbi:MAG: toll/interleukin-1 receptor domain-containing protein [Cytophagales bacterium]|nr:toll/interleukin-1 receptor domain-containing protein [Cytophagales bacterium]
MAFPSQEEILKQILKQDWKSVLEFLYANKKDIRTDGLLQFAARTFETEFFRQLSQENADIEFEILEELYILHSGKFHEINESNYRNLIRELAKKSKGIDAYNFASIFPDDEVCKEIMKKNAHLIKKSKSREKDKLDKVNWIEIYNRLFELINNSDDQSTYFSGNRFIKTLKEFEPYHPDYYQYIELRNSQGKSTSRKIYYYDILMELSESIRIDFISKILEMVEPFESQRVNPIRILLSGQRPVQKPKPTAKVSDEVTTVFISYSWDNEVHKKWVLDLADRLVDEGVNVLLDRYELRPGKSLPYFVETSLKKADRILIIFTPNYKLKAEKRSGGVGYEYSIMNADLYQNQTTNERIIPVLRSGLQAESIPEFMQQYIHIDMKSDTNFETSLSDLLREIYDEPEIVKPELGTKRNFT